MQQNGVANDKPLAIAQEPAQESRQGTKQTCTTVRQNLFSTFRYTCRLTLSSSANPFSVLHTTEEPMFMKFGHNVVEGDMGACLLTHGGRPLMLLQQHCRCAALSRVVNWILSAWPPASPGPDWPSPKPPHALAANPKYPHKLGWSKQASTSFHGSSELDACGGFQGILQQGGYSRVLLV